MMKWSDGTNEWMDGWMNVVYTNDQQRKMQENYARSSEAHLEK